MELRGSIGQIVAGADNDNEYLLGTNRTAAIVLTIPLPDLLNGGVNASLVVGSRMQNVQTVTNGTGTVTIIEGQNYGGLTTVNSGSTLISSGVPTVANPLGNGSTINIYGTLTLTGGDNAQVVQTVINVSQARGANGVLNLTVNDFAFAGVGTTNERLKDMAVLNYNGGTLTFAGYNSGNATEGTPIVSAQTIGTFNASAANLVNVTTSTLPTENLDAVLTFTNLNRVNNGTVAFASSGTTQPAFGAPSIGNGPTIPTNRQNSSDSRVFINNLNGSGVAPVVTNGIIAPWMIDVSNLPLGATGSTVSGSTAVTVVSAVELSPGMIVTGANIPTGASVVSVFNATRVTSGTTTIGSTAVNVADTSSLVVGMTMTGAGIPTGAKVASITDGTTFELSTAATVAATAQTYTTSALFNLSRTATASATGQTFTANAQQFLTYGANGIAPAAFTVQATNATQTAKCHGVGRRDGRCGLYGDRGTERARAAPRG